MPKSQQAICINDKHNAHKLLNFFLFFIYITLPSLARQWPFMLTKYVYSCVKKVLDMSFDKLCLVTN